jgi:hypothetical protein
MQHITGKPGSTRRASCANVCAIIVMSRKGHCVAEMTLV